MADISAAQAKEELLALMHAWTRAVGAKDASYFEQHVDEGWEYTDYTGAYRGKSDYWELIQNVDSYVEDFRRFDVRLVAERVALVTGIYQAQVEQAGGGRLEKLLAFSAAWELRQGVWKALLHQSTELHV